MFDFSAIGFADILPFIMVGFAAQIVDGALGMAFGVLTQTMLVSVLGMPPAAASASTHLVEVFTTGASGISHAAHRNVDWKLFWRICMGTALAVGSAMLVSVGFAKLASVLFGVSFGTALIAYAPGGQDAMMVLALALGVDPIFVSAHHLARYFIINVSLPFLIARMQRDEGQVPQKGGTAP